MQFKQSLLAAVYFAVFAIAAPAVNLSVLSGCPASGEPTVGTPSGPTDGSVNVDVPVSVGNVVGSEGDLPGGDLPGVDPSGGLSGVLGGVLGSVGSVLDGVLDGVPGIGNVGSGKPSGPSKPSSDPYDPTGSPAWGEGPPAGKPSGPSASAGVSATLSTPSASTSVTPISTSLATSVSAPIATLSVTTIHVPSVSAPASASQTSTPASSSSGSPNSHEQSSGHNSSEDGGWGTCSTGPVQCCNSVQKSDSPEAEKALGSLSGLGLVGPDVLVGLTCTPIDVLGLSGASSCTAQTVCCEDNSHGGLVSIGCVPVSL